VNARKEEGLMAYRNATSNSKDVVSATAVVVTQPNTTQVIVKFGKPRG
jgi:hypothetical protein